LKYSNLLAFHNYIHKLLPTNVNILHSLYPVHSSVFKPIQDTFACQVGRDYQNIELVLSLKPCLLKFTSPYLYEFNFTLSLFLIYLVVLLINQVIFLRFINLLYIFASIN